MPISFLICTFKSNNPDSLKFELLTGILAHVLFAFDWSNSLQRLNRLNEVLRGSDKKLDKLIGIQQSLVVFSSLNAQQVNRLKV